jgi:endonuclease YncB( thermonuclease family)
MKAALAIILVVLSTASAGADPCEATLPASGTQFSGTVRYVGDGDSLCVGNTANPSDWIEVRIADFYAPELNSPGGRDAKAALERVAMGKQASCVAGRRSYDRVVATCNIGGQSVADWMRAAGINEGGRGK